MSRANLRGKFNVSGFSAAQESTGVDGRKIISRCGV